MGYLASKRSESEANQVYRKSKLRIRSMWENKGHETGSWPSSPLLLVGAELRLAVNRRYTGCIYSYH